MPVLMLDTQAVMKELQAAGFTEAQVEPVTHAVQRDQDIDPSDLVTKADRQADQVVLKADVRWPRAELNADNQELRSEFELLRQFTKADIDSERQSLRLEIGEVRSDLLKMVIGIVGVQTIVIRSAVACLNRFLPR